MDLRRPPARLRPAAGEALGLSSGPRRTASMPGPAAEDQYGAVARPSIELSDAYGGLEESLARRERLDMHR